MGPGLRRGGTVGGEGGVRGAGTTPVAGHRGVGHGSDPARAAGAGLRRRLGVIPAQAGISVCGARQEEQWTQWPPHARGEWFHLGMGPGLRRGDTVGVAGGVDGAEGAPSG